METIHKYPLEVTDTQFIELPLGAEILTVQTQDDQLYLWAMVNTWPDILKKHRCIEIIGTGNPVPTGNLRYISTIQMMGGGLIFHVFENI